MQRGIFLTGAKSEKVTYVLVHLGIPHIGTSDLAVAIKRFPVASKSINVLVEHDHVLCQINSSSAEHLSPSRSLQSIPAFSRLVNKKHEPGVSRNLGPLTLSFLQNRHSFKVLLMITILVVLFNLEHRRSTHTIPKSRKAALKLNRAALENIKIPGLIGTSSHCAKSEIQASIQYLLTAPSVRQIFFF